MERSWLSIAVAAVLSPACAQSSDESSKLKDAPSEQTAEAKPATEDPQRSHALRETVEVISRERSIVTIHVEGEVGVRTGRENELEKWGGESWYEASVSDRVRSALREQFQRLHIAEVEAGAQEAAKGARSQLIESLRETPFDIRALSIVKVELPKQYLDAERAKQEAEKERERMEAEMNRVKREAEERQRNR